MSETPQNQSSLDDYLRQIGVGLALLGLLSGFVVGYGALIGDEQGRVNLLFLLGIFAGLPIVTLVLSLLFILRRGGRGLAGWLLELPFWPRHLSASLLTLEMGRARKSWLVHQGQALGLSFSVGTLFVYLLLLVGTDMNFVWRSTVLEAENLLPVLQFLSWPWRWWPEAQPTLQLLQLTQDFRLASNESVLTEAGAWWRYILALQITYSLLPRSLLWFFSGRRLRTLLAQMTDVSPTPAVENAKPNPAPVLAKVIADPDSPWCLYVWGNIDSRYVDSIQSIYGDADQVITLEPLVEQHASASSVVVLVRSWEPPLAELADVLLGFGETGQRLILPIDWKQGALRQPSAVHFEEWCRFAGTLPGWQILQRKEVDRLVRVEVDAEMEAEPGMGAEK